LCTCLYVFFMFLSCLFSVLYVSLESVWFAFSKFLMIRPSCKRNCLTVFSHVFLSILFPFNKFYPRNFLRVYFFQITKWNSETKLELHISPLCVSFTPFFREIFFCLSRATYPVVSSSECNCECASELEMFRLVLSENSNIYSPFSRKNGGIFMQWIV
jgi:hypothetical protein